MHRAVASVLLAAFFVIAASLNRSFTGDGTASLQRPVAESHSSADAAGKHWFNPGWLGLFGLTGLLGLRKIGRDDL